MTGPRRRYVEAARGARAGAILLLAALAWLATARPAAAQTTPGLRCGGDRPDRGCDAARVRRQRALYDMPPLEQLRDEGVEVRRVFFSQAMEWDELDLGALVFERRPGHGPTVRFQLPRGRDDQLPEPLVADLTLDAWRDVLARSEGIERRFVPSTNAQDACLFGWDYMVEIATPAATEGGTPYLYRRVENACINASPAEAYVRGLATLAERFFPACGVLRFPEDTEAVSRLPLCAALEGDRIAAAEVRNAIAPFLDFDNAAEAARLYDAFAYDAELDWNGEQVSGGRAVADRWARGASQSSWPSFRITSLRGETGARVRVRGELGQTEARQGPDEQRRAPVEMIWIRGGDGRFQLRRATVGAFEALPPEPTGRQAGRQ